MNSSTLSQKLVSVFFIVVFAGCSTKPAEPEAPKNAPPAPAAGASIEAKQMAAEQEALFVSEISFAKGASRLDDKAKSKLQEMIGQAERAGTIDAVHIVTWADREYPSPQTKKLSKREQDLVKARNTQLEEFFETMPGKMKVVSHSMAERPGVFKDFWGGDDVRIKKSLEAAGIPTTDTAVKIPSKAAKTIVFVVLKSKS